MKFTKRITSKKGKSLHVLGIEIILNESSRTLKNKFFQYIFKYLYTRYTILNIIWNIIELGAYNEIGCLRVLYSCNES